MATVESKNFSLFLTKIDKVFFGTLYLGAASLLLFFQSLNGLAFFT